MNFNGVSQGSIAGPCNTPISQEPLAFNLVKSYHDFNVRKAKRRQRNEVKIDRNLRRCGEIESCSDNLVNLNGVPQGSTHGPYHKTM